MRDGALPHHPSRGGVDQWDGSRLNVHGPTLIIVPEYKGMVYGDEGIRLVTSAIRRNSPQFLDSHIHHNNLLNNILAKIDANVAGVDDAVMLDDRGFLAETNATNLFVVRRAPADPRACLPAGLTRRLVLDIAARVGIATREADLSLTELYTAKSFTTGTMGALAHVTEVDTASPMAKKARSPNSCNRPTRTTSGGSRCAPLRMTPGIFGPPCLMNPVLRNLLAGVAGAIASMPANALCSCPSAACSALLPRRPMTPLATRKPCRPCGAPTSRPSAHPHGRSLLAHWNGAFAALWSPDCWRPTAVLGFR